MSLCTKCRAPLPDGARFCMNCGQASAPLAGGASFPTSAPSSVPKIAAIVAIGVITLFGLGWGLRAAGILKLGGSAGGEVTKASNSIGGEILKLPGQAGGEITRVHNERKTMPKEIYDWLEHLRKTDEKAAQLSSKQVSDLSITKILTQTGVSEDTMRALLWGDPGQAELRPPTDDLAKKAQAAQAEWEELRRFFNEYPPPPECIPIRNSYEQGLKETGGMIYEILTAIAQVFEDPSKAHQMVSAMKGDSVARIDERRKESDRQVQEVCDRYDTRKWFSIPGDFGGGMMGQMGLPNVGPTPQNISPPPSPSSDP
ncbi:MAG TPA: zinc ribbon domain-containing protein [Fimbriimonadaceae bacterium]|nr:zinc ribbon domain-containing protein [Fimbriimonadaceae bacterium]HRJ33856.1 zinc ribbon domain-containing protein [Fimbriimonadaceae bacterium]